MIELYENIDNVIKILKDNNLVYNSYNFLVRIYMVPNNLNFGNIKSLEQLKNYAILEDNNREKKVIFKDNNELIGSISGLLSTKSLLTTSILLLWIILVKKKSMANPVNTKSINKKIITIIVAIFKFFILD